MQGIVAYFMRQGLLGIFFSSSNHNMATMFVRVDTPEAFSQNTQSYCHFGFWTLE